VFGRGRKKGFQPGPPLKEKIRTQQEYPIKEKIARSPPSGTRGARVHERRRKNRLKKMGNTKILL